MYSCFATMWALAELFIASRASPERLEVSGEINSVSVNRFENAVPLLAKSAAAPLSQRSVKDGSLLHSFQTTKGCFNT